MPPTYKQFLRRLLTGADPRPERDDPCSGEGCGARRHVARGTSAGRGADFGTQGGRPGTAGTVAASLAVDRNPLRVRGRADPARLRCQLRLKYRGFVACQSAKGTWHGPPKICKWTHLPKRRPEPTNSACHSPYGEDMGSRARCARSNVVTAGLGGLPATSPIIVRWSAKSGGAIGRPLAIPWAPPTPDGRSRRAGDVARPLPWQGRGG